MATKTPRFTKPARNSETLKHRQVWQTLRNQIVSGHYPPGARLPTELELPKLLKAGKQTVVRALNELVREGLVVRRRGDGSYVADASQAPLIPGRNLRLGVLWKHSVFPERLLSTFQGAMACGALSAWGLQPVQGTWPSVEEDQSTRAQWSLVSRGVSVECIGESSEGRERHPHLEDVKSGRYDGILALSIIEEDWLETVLALGLPSVLVDFPNERFATRADQVYTDPLPGYRAVVKHFVSLGLERIHFVGAQITRPTHGSRPKEAEGRAGSKAKHRADPDSYLRLAAWRTGMDECGLQASEAAVHFPVYGLEAELAEQLLTLPKAQRPEAVVCHGAAQADTLIKAFACKSVRLFGAGVSGGEYAGPALQICANGKELGRVAAELLLWKIKQTDRPILRVGVPMSFQGSS